MKERIVRAVAGTIVLASISLAYFVNINWLWLGVFVGANLLQSSFTKFCPLEMILDYFGVRSDKTILSFTDNGFIIKGDQNGKQRES